MYITQSFVLETPRSYWKAQCAMIGVLAHTVLPAIVGGIERSLVPAMVRGLPQPLLPAMVRELPQPVVPAMVGGLAQSVVATPILTEWFVAILARPTI